MNSFDDKDAVVDGDNVMIKISEYDEYDWLDLRSNLENVSPKP